MQAADGMRFFRMNREKAYFSNSEFPFSKTGKRNFNPRWVAGVQDDDEG